MPLRLRSSISRIVGCTIVLLVVIVPLQALADEPLIGGAEASLPTAGVVTEVVETVEVIEEVEPAAEMVEVVEPAAEVVEVVEPVAEVAAEVGQTAGGAVESVGDAAAEVVNEAPTVEEAQGAAGNASGQVQGNAGAAANNTSTSGGSAADAIAGSGGSTDTGASPGAGKQAAHGAQPTDERITVASTGSAWRRTHFARLGVVVPAASFLFQPLTLQGNPADEPEVDPCEDDPGLACLGLLFGIGEFAEAGKEILGLFLAATGVALRGLIVLAFALLLAGVIALSIAPRRATPRGTG